MKELILVRGCPGSGKSTFAKLLGGKHIEADMFFMKDGEYQFDFTKLKDGKLTLFNPVFYMDYMFPL
jgi:predicted kinase